MGGGATLQQRSVAGAFAEFATAAEPRLRHALIATLGLDGAADATAEALAYGWENWSRVSEMENPVGYLYRVAQTSGRTWARRSTELPSVPTSELPWVEPGLPDALAKLTSPQRTAVWLVHGLGWKHTEVAELLEVSPETARTHTRRAMESLRGSLGGGS